MNTLHEIKLNIAFCDAVLSGEKTFEVRYNDRCYQKGDRVRFIPVRDCAETTHEIYRHLYEITYVVSGWGIENGYVVFGIKEI